MLALPWNTRVLKFLAFDVSERPLLIRDLSLESQEKPLKNLKKEQFLKLLKRLYRTLILVILVVGGVFTSAYAALTVPGSNVKLVLGGVAAYFAVLVLEVIWIQRHTLRMTRLISGVIDLLDEKEVQFLRRHDRKGFFCRLLAMTIPSMIAILLLLCLKTRKELFELFFKTPTEQVLHALAYSLFWEYNMWTGHFYWTTVTVAKVYARHSKDKIRLMTKNINCEYKIPTARVFEEIQKSLDEYFRFVREINRLVGSIPLALFAILFMDIVIGLSFLVMQDLTSIPTGYVILGLTIGNQFWSIFQIVCVTTRSNNLIEEAVVMADKFACKKLSDMTNTHLANLALMESRRSLTVFLQKQTIVRFTAQSTFVLEPSVVLSFLNSVIPFTVMFITSIIQASRMTYYHLHENHVTNITNSN